MWGFNAAHTKGTIWTKESTVSNPLASNKFHFVINLSPQILYRRDMSSYQMDARTRDYLSRYDPRKHIVNSRWPHKASRFWPRQV